MVWLVVLFLFISSSGCALLKQSENEIAQSNFVPLSNFDREWYYGQLPGSNKPLKSLYTKLLEKKWLASVFLSRQIIAEAVVTDLRKKISKTNSLISWNIDGETVTKTWKELNGSELKRGEVS